jgi:transcriptional regulator with XRE-family HTH domain
MLTTRTLRELREGRLERGLSQREVSAALGCTQAGYAKFEAGMTAPSVVRLSEVASVLGFEISLGLHPLGDPIRDKGQQALAKRLRAVLGSGWRVAGQEAALAISGDLRGWDVDLRHASGQFVGIDCETRIRDVQALVRRTHLRERDGGADQILLVLSDSGHNRRLADDLREALGEPYRTSARVILAALREGRPLPGSGVVLV